MTTTENPFLNLTQKFLQNFRINSFLIEPPYEWKDAYDGGLLQKISSDQSIFSQNFSHLLSNFSLEPRIIIITNELEISYIVLRLPDSENIILFGPYSYELITDQRSIELCSINKIPVSLNTFMQMYYSSLPYIKDENIIISIMNCLGEKLWKDTSFQIETSKIKMNQSIIYEGISSSPSSEMLSSLEKRYEAERNIMNAISLGNYDLVKSSITPDVLFKQRFPDSVRDEKNKLIILNTICRKAAELGQVHPVYLDDLSRKFALKIENTNSAFQLHSIEDEMFKKYCSLVQRHSLRNYSSPIQNTINYINIYLSENLSLNTIAQKMNLNSSYLSTLFKRETGKTLTKYVNEKRVEHAVYLLSMSNLSIQEIASLCGISDVNYFSRLFKQIKHMTPSDYRNSLIVTS